MCKDDDDDYYDDGCGGGDDDDDGGGDDDDDDGGGGGDDDDDDKIFSGLSKDRGTRASSSIRNFFTRRLVEGLQRSDVTPPMEIWGAFGSSFLVVILCLYISVCLF